MSEGMREAERLARQVSSLIYSAGARLFVTGVGENRRVWVEDSNGHVSPIEDKRHA